MREPMTEERLAELENWSPWHSPDLARVRELVAEVRRLQKTHDSRCISLTGKPENRVYFDCRTLAILDYAQTEGKDEKRRLRDLVDEFRKREESQDRIRERLTRERDEVRAERIELQDRIDRALTFCHSPVGAHVIGRVLRGEQ